MLLFGCGKDKKKSTTVTGSDLIDIENGDFDFFMGIVSYSIYEKAPYMVMIQSYNEDVLITSVELKINNAAITLISYVSFYYAELNLTQGQTVSYEAKINGTTYSGNLTIPYRPQNVTFPAVFNPAQSYNITWSLAQNSQFQMFEAYGWNANNEQETGKYKELSPSDRSFTIPANWIGSGYDEYDLALSEFSANWSGKFIAISFDGAWEYYGEDWKSEPLKIREKVLTFTEMLKK
jgi:hypothetical protein